MLGTSAPELSRPRLAAYPDDETLIQKAVAAAKADIVNGTPWQGFGTPRDINRVASRLREFSEWLKTHAKSAIAGRLDDPSLQEDRKTYLRVKDSSRRRDLNLLSTYNSRRESPASAISDSDLDLLELLEQEMEVEEPPSTAGDIAPQHTLLQATPAAAAMRDDGLELRTHLALLEQEMEVDGPTEIWEGDSQLNSFQESLEQLLVVPSTPPAYDFAAYVPLDWSGGPAPPLLIAELNKRNLLPKLFQERRMLIRNMHYTAVLRPSPGPVTPYNPRGDQIDLTPGSGTFGLQIQSRFRQTNETTARNPLGGNVTRAERYAEMQSDRRIYHRSDRTDGQASGSGVRVPAPPLLHNEWLTDAHITADYTGLERELQRDHPDLAARMRLLRPAVAQLLLTVDADELRTTVQGIVYDRDQNDTADFLLVPVNDGRGVEADDGSHWSLLLVDRRNRENVVAHHYDSNRNFNLTRAEQLAERLGANLQSARMAQQRNNYDCGVFVVDATRTLARRLAEGERPDDEPLHLDNLVADRRALQDRLSGRAHLTRRLG
ncbi:Ulp1 family isopeptidase [Bradyrhizobium sp. LeoA1S1]